MRALVILLFSTTLVLATEYRNNNGQNEHRGRNRGSQTYFPTNYFENQNLKAKPESTFAVNNGQGRRYQPTQLEIREEDVERYFPRKPTTTTPASIFSMKVNDETQHVYFKMNPLNSEHNKPEGMVQMVPESHYRSRFVNRKSRPTQIQTTAEDITYAPSVSHESDLPKSTNKKQFHQKPNRGTHKFSWDDVKSEFHEPIAMKQPIVPQNSQSMPLHQSPPPVPTLSPWYDGFGK